MRAKKVYIALFAAALALAAAGCGSSSDGTSGGAYGGGSATTESTSESTTKAPKSASKPSSLAVVTVNTVPKLGKVIVTDKGQTLYDFHKDKGTTSSCYGNCAEVWPPLTTAGPPKGLMGLKLGTAKRKDGTVQVTFAGHPLYTYVEDTKPGEANGNDFSSFGAQWYALTPSGAEADG